MNQQLVAGIGNVYKSEILFMNRLNPLSRCRRWMTKQCECACAVPDAT